MIRIIAASLALVLVAAGCRKAAPAAAADTPSAEASSATAAAPPSTRGPGPVLDPASPPVVADNGNVDANLNQLSLELRKYVVRTRSVPTSFEDFVAKSHLQAPPAPSGKKYAIQGQSVVLVKL